MKAILDPLIDVEEKLKISHRTEGTARILAIAMHSGHAEACSTVTEVSAAVVLLVRVHIKLSDLSVTRSFVESAATRIDSDVLIRTVFVLLKMSVASQIPFEICKGALN